MKNNQPSILLAVISFYKYCFSFLMAIFLFILPITISPSEFLEPTVLDVLLRFGAWFFFVFCYWSLSTALISQITGAGRFYWNIEKNLMALIMYAISAIMLGLSIWIVTRWVLLILVSGLAKEMLSVIAVLNGLVYAVLTFSRYFWLHKDK